MKLVIGSDHGGFSLKEGLVALLAQIGHDVADLGTYSEAPVDYPDFAILVAAAVAGKEADLGILIDGAGIGSSIVANKFPGVRAALCNDLYAARNSREHNNANVLTLGARVVGTGLAAEIVKVFLATPFSDRHQPRLDKIAELERQLFVDRHPVTRFDSDCAVGPLPAKEASRWP